MQAGTERDRRASTNDEIEKNVRFETAAALYLMGIALVLLPISFTSAAFGFEAGGGDHLMESEWLAPWTWLETSRPPPTRAERL